MSRGDAFPATRDIVLAGKPAARAQLRRQAVDFLHEGAIECVRMPAIFAGIAQLVEQPPCKR